LFTLLLTALAYVKESLANVNTVLVNCKAEFVNCNDIANALLDALNTLVTEVFVSDDN
jgi:hypothetical protein